MMNGKEKPKKKYLIRFRASRYEPFKKKIIRAYNNRDASRRVRTLFKHTEKSYCRIEELTDDA